MAATRNVLIGIAVLSAALLAMPVDAQTSRSGGDRRGQQAEERPALFPNASRAEPGGKVSSRLQRPMNAMIAALNDDEDPAKARELAEGILANERANAFEKSVAAQVAGNAAAEMDDLPASIEYLKRAVAENGLDNDAHYSSMQNLAVSQLNNDQAQEAIATLTQLIAETKTENPEIHYALAGANLEAEQYPAGIAALEKAIGYANPPKPEWKRLLVSAHLENQDPAAAAKAGEALLAETPDDKRLLLTVASAYLDLEQQDRAIALLESARTRGLLADARDYQTLYALYFNADGREKDVIAVIQEGLSKGLLQRDVQTLSALAQAAYFAEDMALSMATYKEAAALDPKGDTGLNYAKVLSAEAKDAEARDAAKAALAKGVAKPGDAWMVIARSEAQLDNTAATRAALQEAAKFAETRDQANRMLQQIR
jgi:predicted Zn-dependent protease